MVGRRKKQQARIAEMLAEGHTVAAIAEETGATERTVYRHKAAQRKHPQPASAAALTGGLEAAADTPASGRGRLG